MKITRWLTIFILLVLLFPVQPVQAGKIKTLSPVVTITPFTQTTTINSTVTYQVHITDIPNGGLHCVRVKLYVPAHFKIYPGAGYSYYHIYDPTTLDFKVKAPNKTVRAWLSASVSWSRDYACRSIRTTNYGGQSEMLVIK